jgi:hypothetical protein
MNLPGWDGYTVWSALRSFICSVQRRSSGPPRQWAACELVCPVGFREDVVRVARNCGPGVTIEQVAADFGVHAMTLWKWMRWADIDDGTKTGTNNQESAELREARRRIKLLKQENEVLPRAAA